jgi:hypothetical protein
MSPATQAIATTTKPTTTVASTKPSQADKMNFLAGKEITSATLTADGPERVEIKSEQYADGKVLLRALNLYATTVTTNRATGRLEVPVPGEMLVRDYRPPEVKKDPAAAPGASAKGGPTLGNGRGNTAFKWSKSLIYDDAQHQAVMNGDVVVVHNPITKEGEPFNLWADTLTAEMEADPSAKAATQPAAATTGKSGAAKQDKMRLKRVLATGKVRVESQRMNIDASELSFDPVAQVLHARGSEGVPMTIFDKEKGTTSTAGELEWNTASDQFRIKDLSGKVRQ